MAFIESPPSTPEILELFANVSIMSATESNPSISSKPRPSKSTPPTLANVPLPNVPANPPAPKPPVTVFKLDTTTFWISPPIPSPMTPPA